MSNWGGTPRECDHGKYPKPTWPQFLIYKIKGCEKIASGDKSMGMVSVWRPEGPIIWPGLHPLNQLVLVSPQDGNFGDFNLLK